MAKQWIAAALGALAVINGAAMLIDGRGWYEAVPGVVGSGPFNAHFVADIGAAFVAAGLGLAARAWRAQLWPAAATGAAFLVLHALIHLAGQIAGDARRAAFEWIAVVIPAVLAAYAAIPDAITNKGEAK